MFLVRGGELLLLVLKFRAFFNLGKADVIEITNGTANILFAPLPAIPFCLAGPIYLTFFTTVYCFLHV